MNATASARSALPPLPSASSFAATSVAMRIKAARQRETTTAQRAVSPGARKAGAMKIVKEARTTAMKIRKAARVTVERVRSAESRKERKLDLELGALAEDVGLRLDLDFAGVHKHSDSRHKKITE